MARLSLPAILALTEEISHQVSTCPSIMTGVGAAVIDVWAAIGQNKIYVRYIKCGIKHTFHVETWIWVCYDIRPTH